jgi:fatty acid desaturase
MTAPGNEKGEQPKVAEGGAVFRHTALDGVLVLLTLIHVAAVIATAEAFAHLGGGALVALAVFFIAMVCTNYQCIAHNFLHNRFFRAEPLNHAFSVLNTLALGMPQTLYRMHHLNHHRYNSDYRDPVTGETGDFSSLYRFSKHGEVAESIWRYSLLGPLRTDFGRLLALARKNRLTGLVVLETVALLVFYGALAWLNWKFFLLYFVPVAYLGQAAAMAENHLEHYGADPRERGANSVSCYGRLYNLVWFNNGYHQEHHFRPSVHWRQVPLLRARMLPETERRVVKGSHLANLFSNTRPQGNTCSPKQR